MPEDQVSTPSISTSAPTVEMARAELARAAVAAFGEAKADELLRVFEVSIVEAANAIVDAQYERLVRRIADLVRGDVRVGEGVDPLLEIEQVVQESPGGEVLRVWSEAMDLSIGPLHADRLDGGDIQWGCEQALLQDVADVLARGWD